MLIVVIDGPDGVGKTTVANLVVKKLQEKKVKAIYQHFPDYDYSTGETIKRCLEGENGDFINLDWRVTLAMYDIDRRLWYERNKEKLKDHIVITDRYSLSSFQYQVAQIIMQENSDELDNYMYKYNCFPLYEIDKDIDIKRYMQWLDNAHNNYGVKEPDINFYLKISAKERNTRIANRFETEGTNPDQFENNKVFSLLVGTIGQYLCEIGYEAKFDNTDVVAIDAERSPEEIAEDILNYIYSNLHITINMIDA